MLYNIIGKLAKPTDITVLNGYESGNLFTLSWSHKNRDIDFKEYQIFLNNSYIGRTTKLFFEYKSLELDTKNFKVGFIKTSNLSSDGLSFPLTDQRQSDIKTLKLIMLLVLEKF